MCQSCCCYPCLSTIFNNKKIAITMLMLWLALVVVLFQVTGLLHSSYMRVGPNSETTFMGTHLDTWTRWGVVACFHFVNTAINDFASDSLSPWIITSITDVKARYLPYSKATCLMITQLWSAYCCIMSVLGMLISLTQIDFVLVRMVADLLVNYFTMREFMRNKVVDHSKYMELAVHPAESEKPDDKTALINPV